LVRSTVHPDFAMGGNDMAYPAFVPKGEVWVEKDLVGDARNTTITHELTNEGLCRRASLMFRKMKKSGATHVDALNAEQNVPEGGGEKNASC